MRTPVPPLLWATVSCVGKYTLNLSLISCSHVNSILVGSLSSLVEEESVVEEDGKVSRLLWAGLLPRDWSSLSPLSPGVITHK